MFFLLFCPEEGDGCPENLTIFTVPVLDNFLNYALYLPLLTR